MTGMDVWLDIDNPPQVQYLLPFKRAFERLGASVVVTARDHTITLELLRAQAVPFHSIGSAFGRRKLQKIQGLLGRSRQLLALFGDLGRPRLLLAASRPAAVVARRLGIPSFILNDYEHANLSVFRATGAHIVHPKVIPSDAFTEKGISTRKLIPFDGIKEDITFTGIDADNGVAHDFGVDDGHATVLFRPPAEDSHYYKRGSRALALDLLGFLADRDDTVVVFSPRYARQAEDLKRYAWANEPIVLRDPIPVVSLLKGVDVVVASGGTMIREAAYLGVPAYSILLSRIGGVDRYLESIGRLDVVASSGGFDRMRFERGGRKPPMARNPQLLSTLVETVLAKAESRRESHAA